MDLCQVLAVEEGSSRWKSTPGTSQARLRRVCLHCCGRQCLQDDSCVRGYWTLLGLSLDSTILKVFSILNYPMILLKKGESNHGEGTLSSLWSKLLLKQGQLCSHFGLLRACWVFEMSKDRELTNVLGSQSPLLAVLMKKTFLYISNQSSSFSFL